MIALAFLVGVFVGAGIVVMIIVARSGERRGWWI